MMCNRNGMGVQGPPGRGNRFRTRTTFASRRRRLRPDLFPLEERTLLASTQSIAITVDNPTDTPVAGEIDLRQAIADANGSGSAVTINFDPTVFSTPQTITLTDGGLVLDDTSGLQTIDGPAAGVTINGGGIANNFKVAQNVNAAISGVSFTDFNASGLVNYGTVAADDCTFSGNSTADGFTGAGVQNRNTITLTDCTISGNSADAGGGMYNFGAGTLIDCTVSANSASYGAGGVANGGTLMLTGCTISGNSSRLYGAGLEVYYGSAEMTDTIVAGNTNSVTSGPSDCEGRPLTGTNNLIGTGGSEGLVNDQNGNVVLTNLANLDLSPLGNYGGLTQTIALLPGSAAIGMGTVVNGVTTDERGVPIGTVVDIGAFQTSLVVASASGSIDTTAANLTLPGAVSLADQFAGEEITFDPTVFASAQTITLTAQLELSNTALTTEINGPAADLTISGGGTTRVFKIDSGVTAAFSGLTMTDGQLDGSSDGPSTTSNGAGIFNLGLLTLNDCTISGNSSQNFGGGVYSTGTAYFTDCIISENSAGGGGGAFLNNGDATLMDCTVSGNSAYAGGGFVSAGVGSLTVIDSTIASNSAQVGGGFYTRTTTTLSQCTISGDTARDYGGGLACGYPANVNISRSTFNGDTTSSSYGGAIENGGKTLNLTACTISGNSAGQSGGGLYSYGPATLVDTIIAGNTTNTSPSDIAGKGSISGNNNLIGTGGSGDQTNGQNGNIVLTSLTNLDLSPLGNYGGPTETIALLPGSAAIGMGTGVDGVTTDQRGVPIGTVVDIGAFQTSLVVESASGSIDTTAANLTLPGAVSLADQFAGEAITFDPTVFASAQTITLTAQLELSNTALTTEITGPAADLAISGGGTTRVFKIDSGVMASLVGLTITDGYDNDYGTFGSGGGVFNSGTVTLTACTIIGNTDDYYGGGLYSIGTVTAIDCNISGNSASSGGGICSVYKGTLIDCTISGNSAYDGGGVFILGNATVTDSTISDNTASHYGGGLYDLVQVILMDSIVAGNTITATTTPSDVADLLGGATTGSNSLIGTGGSGEIVNGQDGNIVLTSLTNLDLSPLGNYGGPTETIALLPGSAAIGAGVAVNGITTDERGVPIGAVVDIGAFQTSLVVESASGSIETTAANLTLPGAVSLANEFAGEAITFDPSVFATNQTITLTTQLELSNTALTNEIIGPAAGVTIDGNGADLTLLTLPNVTVTLSRLTITNTGFGGGITNLGTITATNCTVTGIHSSQAAFSNNNTATLSDCTISGNVGGGGILNVESLQLIGCTVTGNSAGEEGTGGGLDNVGNASITDCTFTGNSAELGGGIFDDGEATITDCTFSANSASNSGGGAEFVQAVTLMDCTFSGNTAAENGGGLYITAAAAITACTITGNSAGTSGGGVAINAQLTLIDTIVAGNTISDTSNPSDISGPGTVSGNNNLIGTGGSQGLISGENDNIVLTNLSDLLLSPLGNYGGPTETIALLPGSEAIGNGVAVSNVTTDQRGVVIASAPDIGAFQSQGFTLTAVSGGSPQSAAIGTPFPDPLSVLVTANDPLEPIAGGLVSFAAPLAGASATPSVNTASIGGNGLASVHVSAGTSVGSYTITAAALGAPKPVSFSLTNLKAPAAVTVTSSASSIVYGQPVTLTAIVTASGAVPSGTVTFSSGSKVLGSTLINAAGEATLTVSNLPVGTSSVTASYGGNASVLAASSSQPVTTVSGSSPTSPLELLVTHATSQVVLVPREVLKKRKLVSLELEVEVEHVAPSTSGVPTGTVIFELLNRSKKKPAKVLGVESLTNGAAILPVKPKTVLQQPVEILYNGDADFEPSRLKTTITKSSLVPPGAKSALARDAH
jgi:hypothetical protein